MAHIVFLNSNRAGVQAIDSARAMGHTVSFVCEAELEPIFAGAAFEARRSMLASFTRLEAGASFETLAHAIERIDARTPIDALISVLEPSALPAAAIARSMGLRASNPESVALARSKGACRDRLRRSGLPSAAHVVTDSIDRARAAAAAIGYPVVAKPTAGMASILASIVRSDEELTRYFDAFEHVYESQPPGLRNWISRSLLIESFLEGPLFSVEIGRLDGKTYPFMVTQRKQASSNPAIEIGSTMPADICLADWDEMVRHAEQVIEVIGLETGIFHVEIIRTVEGPRLVEVNPRLMGGTLPVLYRHCTGCDIYCDLIRIFLGQEPELPDRAKMVPTTSRFLGPEDDARITVDLPVNWLDGLRDAFTQIDLSVAPGQFVPRMTNSFQGIGAFYVSGATPGESIVKADRAVSTVSNSLGIRLTA